MKSTGSTKERKTIMQRASEVKVRDPGAHARLQFMELDKTAKRSQAKRKKCLDQIDSDKKEIARIEEQIASLRRKYDPLCEHIADSKKQKKKLQDTLDQCVAEERRIMGDTKGVIETRRLEESKMVKKMGSLELELLRGYNMNPESTFHQTRHTDDDEEGFAATAGSRSSPKKIKNTTGGETLPRISK